MNTPTAAHGTQQTRIIAVIGDAHHHIALAAEGLERLETELGRPIAQVFSVGDLGLFLDEDDWEFLTGPKKYRAPEASPGIRRAWSEWRWPLSMVAGNHEPLHRLRDWDAANFSFKLDYTDAGELAHRVPGLRVTGLSGIYHPQEMEFLTPLERQMLKTPPVDSWPAMVALAQENRIRRSRLAYYKEAEVAHVKSLPTDLLLLHDWPVAPPHLRHDYPRRPEAEIVAAVSPAFTCCGHHHTAADFACGTTRVLALNIISTKEGLPRHFICPGWCAVLEWDGTKLTFLQSWPARPAI